MVAEDWSKEGVTGKAVYDVEDRIAVSHSTKVVGVAAQSVITAVQTKVHGVAVRRSVITVCKSLVTDLRGKYSSPLPLTLCPR